MHRGHLHIKAVSRVAALGRQGSVNRTELWIPTCIYEIVQCGRDNLVLAFGITVWYELCWTTLHTEGGDV